MVTNEFDYYLMDEDYRETSPLLEEEDDQDIWFLEGNEPVEMEEPVRLCFGDPIPKKPILIDYHSMPDSVVSKKIYDVLAPMNIYGIQLIPAVIRNNKTKKLYDNYWVIYVYNEIACLDRENADYEIDEDNGKVDDIETLVLDKKILSEIPLEKRLAFLLGEARSKCIYHKSVVEAIMSVNPEGIAFCPIEEWHEGIQFEQ
jgi:hypothetical protein